MLSPSKIHSTGLCSTWTPNDSIYAMQEVYRVIIRHHAVPSSPTASPRSGPCGTHAEHGLSAVHGPGVTADRSDRSRCGAGSRCTRPLLGPASAVYGDHVELTAMKTGG